MTAEKKLYISATSETIPTVMLAVVPVDFVLGLHHAVAANDEHIENTVILFLKTSPQHVHAFFF